MIEIKHTHLHTHTHTHTHTSICAKNKPPKSTTADLYCTFSFFSLYLSLSLFFFPCLFPCTRRKKGGDSHFFIHTRISKEEKEEEKRLVKNNNKLLHIGSSFFLLVLLFTSFFVVLLWIAMQIVNAMFNHIIESDEKFSANGGCVWVVFLGRYVWEWRRCAYIVRQALVIVSTISLFATILMRMKW